MRVGIEENNELVLNERQPALQGDRFAAVALPNESNSRVVPRDFFDLGGGLIAGAVVHHQHFDCARMIVSQNRAQGRGDHLLLIEGGNQNADRRAKIRRNGSRPAKTRREKNHDQGTNHDQRRGDDHEGPKKFLGRVKDTEARATHQAGNRAGHRQPAA